MRRNMLMLLAAALLVVAGCKKDDKNANGEKMTFNAGFDKGGAKTEINGYDLSWKQNDAVSINGGIFTAQKAGPTTTLVGDEVDKVDGLYKAYYPAGIYNGGTPTLPSIQTYSGNDLSDVNPMYAQGSTTDLTFSSICAVLKLQLTGSETVKEIRVTADKPLSGEFEIAEGGAGYKAVMKNKDGNAGVTLNCGAGVDLSASNVFYVALPEGDYTNLKFFVVTTDNKGASIMVASPLQANKLYDVERTPEFKDIVVPSVTVTGPCVSCAYNVGGTVTVPEGSHACEFGLVYAKTADDATPTIAEGATKIVVHKMEEDAISATVSFKADLSCLEKGVKYSVRAYALCDEPAYSSEETVMNIIGGEMPQPLPSNWTNGKSPYPFTVDNGEVVYFSRGNLQYTTTGTHSVATGGTESGTWRFAEHQFDFIGDANSNISPSYEGWIDLFGWGTSGYSDKYPYMTVQSGSDYGDGKKDISGTNYDWGVYNAISNGGNTVNSWRTLTKGEWNYLIKSRTNAENLYGMGKVGNCTPGLIILPDKEYWKAPGDVPAFQPGCTAWANAYTYSQWAKMETAGAVFLPATNFRTGKTIMSGFYDYWSSSCHESASSMAYDLDFSTGQISADLFSGRYYGLPVRLVSKN